MTRRDLAKPTTIRYFSVNKCGNTQSEGTRELRYVEPFVISGGKNTERFYFQHISALTQFKFNIEPKYFGDESRFATKFPKKIKEIFAGSPDAKIFCVFDLDTIVFGSEKSQENYNVFLKKLKNIKKKEL